ERHRPAPPRRRRPVPAVLRGDGRSERDAVLMRRSVLLLAAAAAACAVPEPCTRALCPTKVLGTYRVAGWKSAATVDASVPPVPIASDADITVTSGQIEFVNNKALIVAAAGAQFKILVSTQPRPVPQLYVSS